MKEISYVGQVVEDNIYQKKFLSNNLGGSAFYSNIVYKLCGFNITLSTSTNDNLIKKIKKIFFKNFFLKNKRTNRQTVFTVKYEKKNFDKRKLLVNFNNSKITTCIVKTPIIHFGPLLNDDISFKTYKSIRKFNSIKILDIQGLLRFYNKKSNEVYLSKNENLFKIISCFNILKINDVELNFCNKLYFKKKGDIFNYLFSIGVKEILLTHGSKGSSIYYNNGKKIKIPVFKEKKIIDTTGCGDIYAATYSVFRFHNFSVKESAIAASKVAGLRTSMNEINYSKIKKLIKKLVNEKN